MATKILSLMFHRVNDPTTGCDPEQFSTFLSYLVKRFPVVMPDDPLPKVPLAIMLTFDDAYYDFYHNVFPLLKQHNIKALLAVPTQYILDSTSLSPDLRLSVPYPQGMQSPLYQDKAPFCTWEELREMANTPNVVVGSHSFSHANMADLNIDFQQEAINSKQLLERKLNQSVDYFVYPYGKMNLPVHQKIIQHYRYGVRIGSAINYGWQNSHRYIYRIDADKLWKNNLSIDKSLIRRASLKYWMNRLRGK